MSGDTRRMTPARAQRTALLIGVGDTEEESHRFPSLNEAVTADLRVLCAALEGSGYHVEILRDPARNKITAGIAAVSRAAPPGSTLLLYFTGHGVRIGDTDYLVPADALAPADNAPEDWQQDHIRESLLEADISRYLKHCTADTVLWAIDACRSPEDEGEGDASATVFGSSITKGAPNSGFAVLTGCAAGERGGYGEGGSFFTLGLAHAFDPLTEATTVERLFDVARRHTRQLSRQRNGTSQEAQILYGTELQEKTKATVVAEGRKLLESWRDIVLESPLWDRVPPSQARKRPSLPGLPDRPRHGHRPPGPPSPGTAARSLGGRRVPGTAAARPVAPAAARGRGPVRS